CSIDWSRSSRRWPSRSCVSWPVAWRTPTRSCWWQRPTRRPDFLRRSLLDGSIARMQAQRDCLNFLKPAVDALPGPILEVGLGNGRTYDHLRDLFPGRDIYVFERKVAAHPECIPPDDRLFLGEA